MPAPICLAKYDSRDQALVDSKHWCQLQQNSTSPSLQHYSLWCFEPIRGSISAHASSQELKTILKLKNPTLSSLLSRQQQIEEKFGTKFYIKSLEIVFKKVKKDWFILACSNLPTLLYLHRNGREIKLPVDASGLSGKIFEGDAVVVELGPEKKHLSSSIREQFIRAPKLIKKHLEKDSDRNAPCAILVWGWQGKGKWTQPPGDKKPSKKIFSFMPQLPKFQRVPGIIMPKRTPKKRNKVLLVAFIFLLILSISLFLGYNKRQKLELSRQRQQLITDVQYRLEQAESLKNLNPSRAKTLLKEAKTTLEGYHQDESDVDINSLQQKVDHAYGLISRQYFIHEPSVFYNLSLIKDGFKASQVSLSENYLTLVDFSTRTLIRLDINKKSAEIVAGADLVPPSGRLASIPAWIFLELKREFQIIDLQQKKQVTSFKLEKVTIDQLIGYGNNAYVLDKNLGQIWRFRGVQSGLAEPDGFFSDPQDLTYVSQIAIDGSIWFLRLDGGIEKYTTGIKDAYYPEVSMDTPLNSPTQFYTDENLDNLYFLDPQNRRVVEVSKRGQYQSQYIWEEIDSDYQLVVSSSLSKVLLISGDKIYEIDLQKVEHENN